MGNKKASHSNICVCSRSVLIASSAVFILLAAGCARTTVKTSEQILRDERMKWWREARFGMFIHWGLYAVPAGEWKGNKFPGIGEWIMEWADIPVEEYEQLTKEFNPVKFDADRWVKIAKDAGMKYIVITSKHHDGFCLWDSKVSDYDIMDAAPFKRDILKELSEACAKQGIRLCFYHSIMDWHHPDAQAPFYPNYNNRNSSNPNFQQYVDTYLKPQIKELVISYGPLGVLWFDGEWIRDWTEPMGKDMYDYVRGLQPDIIINNRVGKGRKGMQGMSKGKEFAGDFGTPEQRIPPTGLPGVDWETCMTMNDTWGFKSYDHNWKSAKELIRKLADIASKGGNFLLNVGPTAEGFIPQPSVERLAAMGDWMKVNGESIYGTTASPLGRLTWGRCTKKQLPGDDTRLYLHVFNWPTDGKLKVSGLDNKVLKAFLLADKTKASLRIIRSQADHVIEVPTEAPDPMNPVVVLDVKGKAIVIKSPSITADSDIFIDSTDVKLSSDLSDVTIRYTLDCSTPTTQSRAYNEAIRLFETTTITAQLFREGKAIVGASQRTFKKVIPRPAQKLDGLTNGLKYEYYEGEWNKLPDFDSLKPKVTGISENFDISLCQREERFGMCFRGYLKVPRIGIYKFYLQSDDGSKLFIGDQCIVDNDGLHASEEKNGIIALAAGMHPISVIFFEKTGSQDLKVSYSGVGIEKQTIPASAVFH